MLMYIETTNSIYSGGGTLIHLFAGIDDDGLKRLAQCMRMRVSHFQPGEQIAVLGTTIEKVGILLEGNAHIEISDAEGVCTRVQSLEDGDVFGELFFLPHEDRLCLVEADTYCRAMFLDWQHVIRPCPQSCEPHGRLIANLFQLAAEKTRQLSAYTDILSQRTMRQKLLTYLHGLARENGSLTITLPMSFAALSEYLCVDRSAMMRELKNMREEGILHAERRVITLKRFE